MDAWVDFLESLAYDRQWTYKYHSKEWKPQSLKHNLVIVFTFEITKIKTTMRSKLLYYIALLQICNTSCFIQEREHTINLHQDSSLVLQPPKVAKKS